MAKANLNDLIEWLKKDERNRFEIYDLDKNESIEKCAAYSDLARKTGNAMDWFVTLVEKGVMTVQIVKKRKNGSTYVREGCGLNFSLSTGANNNVAASGAPDSPAATPQHYPYQGMAGLGSPAMGLGFPEIMAMRSQSDRYQETKDENVQLKSKLERLEAQNKELETKCLTFQLGAESKPSAVDKLVEGIAANPAALSQIIQSIKGTPSSGLNSPQLEASKLSDIKSIVVDMISNNTELTDDDTTAAYYVLAQAVNKNEKFINDYLQLLKQHKLIENGSNGYNISN